MARPCEFVEEDVLDQATLVFWKHGFDGTSVDDLLAATGVARQSLYNTFGDKRALFLRCLHHYQDHGMAGLREHFATHRPVTVAFEKLFEDSLCESDQRKRMGCLMINTAMELAPESVEVADLVARNQRTFEEIFVSALEAGQERGELASDLDCRAVGRFLVGAFFGLKVLAKSDPTSPALSDVARLSLRCLEA